MESIEIEQYMACLYDGARQRFIPIAVYAPGCSRTGLVPLIFSPGYDKHRDVNAHAYTDYAEVLQPLAAAGYFVISVQHDMYTDPLLPMVRPYRESRMDNWHKGEANLLFVVAELKAQFPELDWSRLVLVGHSNGGDISMLTATHHPHLAHTVVTLDHRRMPMPRVSQPRVASLRGVDFPADAGVIPTEGECQQYGISIVQLVEVRHSDIGAQGTPAQHSYIAATLLQVLMLEADTRILRKDEDLAAGAGNCGVEPAV